MDLYDSKTQTRTQIKSFLVDSTFGDSLAKQEIKDFIYPYRHRNFSIERVRINKTHVFLCQDAATDIGDHYFMHPKSNVPMVGKAIFIKMTLVKQILQEPTIDGDVEWYKFGEGPFPKIWGGQARAQEVAQRKNL